MPRRGETSAVFVTNQTKGRLGESEGADRQDGSAWRCAERIRGKEAAQTARANGDKRACVMTAHREPIPFGEHPELLREKSRFSFP